jgi:threonyl-tRNA synthetase
MHVKVAELLKETGQWSSDVVGARIGKTIVDVHTPIEKAVVESAAAAGTPVVAIRASEPDGLEVVRHSSAHVMAEAVQKLFPGTKVTFGPAVEDGFYYDFAKGGGGTFTEDDLKKIEVAMAEIIERDAPFTREVVPREEAIRLFESMGESFKVEHIRTIPADQPISLYRHGAPGSTWVDLCAGPHVPSTGFLKAFKLTSVAGAYWRGDERNPMLQRIYGTAFASKQALDEHLKALEDARARDHRKLGKELDLFLFHDWAPAMPFFLPRGAFVYNELVSYIRALYTQFGYEEVITPQAFDPRIFKQSGHLENYADNMYRLWTDDALDGLDAVFDQALDAAVKAQPNSTPADLKRVLGPLPMATHRFLNEGSFALKPMNCPSHCLIFGARRRSYRELPWRMADFGRLHRYERGGVVHGLSRVRTFCQDDGHIFCTEDQVPHEIEKFIALIKNVYSAFKFERIDIKLATRPEKRIGTDEEWDRAEAGLQLGLERAGLAFELLPGEGAFYGPKIEFHVRDALKRSWQLGTIQFDPNLPARFDLTYIGEDGREHRPIMLHRAMLGSLERFFSVYLEHCGGNFPTWLAPKQCIVLTVSDKADAYAATVVRTLEAEGIRVDADTSADKLGAKIRNARMQRYPYLLVVGQKEAESGAVGVRSRDDGELGALPLAQFVERVRAEASFPLTAANFLVK